MDKLTEHERELLQALEWAMAEIAGDTRYQNETQRESSVNRASEILRRAQDRVGSAALKETLG